MENRNVFNRVMNRAMKFLRGKGKKSNLSRQLAMADHLQLQAFVKWKSAQIKREKINAATERRNDFRKRVGAKFGVNWKRVVLHASLGTYFLAEKGKLRNQPFPMLVIKNKTGRNTIIHYGAVQG